MAKFANYNSEVLTIRVVDNFLSFLSESIQASMLKKPEILKSNEMVKVEDILKFSRNSDMVKFLVDKKINEISYGGIEDIREFLKSRTGINITNTEEEKNLLTLSIELRNIYTHGRGKVDETFLRRIGRASSLVDAQLGRRLHADFDMIQDMSNNIFKISQRIDSSISTKFGIKRKKYSTWFRNRSKEHQPHSK